jgi:hypothetical protein
MYDYEQANQLQKRSEVNPLTPARYRQFVRHFANRREIVLDVGCNNGRGGIVIKEMPGENVKQYGLECRKQIAVDGAEHGSFPDSSPSECVY